MRNALSSDRRRTFDRVVLYGAVIVDRRKEWEAKIEARKSLELRQDYIARSIQQENKEYA